MTHNWLEHWEKNDIAFHQAEGNPLLKKYWSELHVPKGSTVLVPLCGKTVDMLWLIEQDYFVIGVELSEIACMSFFNDNHLNCQIEKVGNFVRYFNDKISLFCGDFFALTAAMLPPINAVYDRAALIALSDDLRKKYAKQLINLMPIYSQMLLIVYDTTNTVQGPPFPISHHEIDKLYKKNYHIKELVSVQRKEILPHLQEKGYQELNERVFQLQRFIENSA